jgi:phosphopantothenoylcysteine synthetase/decarboxylase
MKKVLLGISSSIAAYKAHDLIRLLVKARLDVHPIVTEHALNFVTPLTLEILSGNRVHTDRDVWEKREMAHIDLKESASLYIIAPATANVIGKCAHGIADDVVTTTYLSVTSPVLMAPAMNPNMYSHEAVQRNLAILRERGVHIIEPESGDVICGDTGQGKLADVEMIAQRALEII